MPGAQVVRRGKVVAAFRASDSYVVLHCGARDLHEKLEKPARRVVVTDDVAQFALDGASVFAKFVKDCDPKIRPGEQVLVVDSADRLLASGDALMSAREMLSFRRGPAVAVRWTNKRD